MQEVSGSIPLGSTSLRLLRRLRLGKPGSLVGAQQTKAAAPKRSEGGLEMKYVYILQSEDREHFYSSLTGDLHARLHKHNSGEVPHTSKFKPWRLKTYIAFASEHQAAAFERYLKTSSGRAFAKKRL